MSKKNATRHAVLGFLWVLTLLMLSCAPTAPVPTTPRAAPAPVPAPAPAPKPTPTPAPAPATRPVVDVAMPFGPAGSVSFIQNVVWSKLLKDHSTWVRATPTAVTGFVKGVEFWEQAKGQGHWALGFVNGQTVEYAKGTGTYQRQGPRKDMTILFPSSAARIYFVSRDGSPFKTMADIKGAKIALGEPGLATFITQKYILENGLGLKEGDYKPLYVTFADAVSLFKEGTVQIASQTDISARGVPYSYLEDLTNSVKTQFIPATKDITDKMNKALGADVYGIYNLQAGTYRNQPAEVPWVGQLQFHTMPRAEPDDLVYELVRVWWDYWNEGAEINPRFALATPQMTKDALKQKWAFEFHPGALKYYKEKGWI